MIRATSTAPFDDGSDDLEATFGSVIRTVLVVDDSRAQRKIVSSILRRWGYHVLEAAGAEAALSLVPDSPVDLVLSDWMMPGKTGLDLRAELGRRFPDRFFYFILLTSRSEKADVSRALESGADDFLSKPLNVEELHARIASAERLLGLQRDLEKKTGLLTEALEELQGHYTSRERDFDEALNLQQSLMSERFLRFDGADVSLTLGSGDHLAGELAGAFPSGDKRAILFAIQVPGDGLAPVLIAARYAGYLTSGFSDGSATAWPDGHASGDGNSVETIFLHLIGRATTEMGQDHPLNLLIADCDLATGETRWINGGKFALLIQRSNGPVELIGNDTSLPESISAATGYSPINVHLAAGDRILVRSDAVTEGVEPDADDIEVGRLKHFLAVSDGLSGPELLGAIPGDVKQGLSGQRRSEGMATLMLEFHGPASAK